MHTCCVVTLEQPTDKGLHTMAIQLVRRNAIRTKHMIVCETMRSSYDLHIQMAWVLSRLFERMLGYLNRSGYLGLLRSGGQERVATL